MTWNEIGLVAFLFILITSWGMLPALGERLGMLFKGKGPPKSSR